MKRERSLRVAGRGVDLDPNLYMELLYGPGGDFRVQCARCRDNEQSSVVGVFDHHEHCGCDRPTPDAGFHEDGSACLSYFPSPQSRADTWRTTREAWWFRSRRREKPPWAERVLG